MIVLPLWEDPRDGLILTDGFSRPGAHLLCDPVVSLHHRFPKWGPRVPRVP